jgi:hypothetical protein
MQVLEDTGVFAYGAGEEVVAVTTGAEVLDVERGLPMAPEFLPPWVIGRIAACVRNADGAGYALTYRYDGRAYVCIVRAGAVEGVA